MSHRLRDGSLTEDPRLDRLVQFDERSRAFPIRSIVAQRPRSYTWRIRQPYVIDQGREGACVGFAITNELTARPAEVRWPNEATATSFAKNLYYRAQMIDPWPGGSYPNASPFYEGTSVLAGMKVAQELGYFKEYRWAFSLEDVVYGVGHNGPAVIGINWYDGMYQPVDGWVVPVGQIVGGHAIMVTSIKTRWKEPMKFWRHRTFDDLDLNRSHAVLYNSWGPSWGDGGRAKISLMDLGLLLDQQGEAVFAVRRTVDARE